MSNDDVTVYEVPHDPEGKGQSRLKRPLSEMETRFAEAYAVGDTKGNATQSALKAGYSEKSAKANSHHLARRPDIVATVNAMIAVDHRPLAIADHDLGVMMERLKKIARFDVGSMFVADANAPGGYKLADLTKIATDCLRKIEIRNGPNGVSLHVEQYNALDAIRLYRDTLFQEHGAGSPNKKVTVEIKLQSERPPETIVVNPG